MSRLLPWILCAAGVVAISHPPAVHAQGADPITRYIVDLRGVTVSLPTTEGWTPTVAEGSDVPGRGFGVDLAAHVYPLRLGPMTVGVGAQWTRARRTSSPDPEVAPAAARPVTTTLTSLAPQVSFNFGHRMGWSYVSGGVGRARIDSVPEGATAPAEEWSKSVNYGGGARWFLSDRVAFSIDFRFHQLSPRPATDARPGGGRIKQSALSVGVSVR